MSNPADSVKLTIDGTPISVPKGTLLIEAARQRGVMIPHFCYHPKLKPDANCRMCLVEIEKMPKLQTACSTPVAEGMVVRTASTVVNQAHKSVLEFILANHPLDCPVCDQGGRCDLQDFSHEYTPTTSRFIEAKRVFKKEYFSPLIETQMNRCVQCLRCVRYCDEVMDVKALAPSGRGTMTEIKHFGSHPLDCEFCGGCVQICPVGAITSRLSMYEYRPWMTKRADTICTYCGDGCAITIQTKDNQLIEVNSSHGAGRNNGDLCPRGFFGYHVSTHPERLTQPLIRRNGALVETTWEDALAFIAEQCLRLKMAHGPDAFAGLISSRCTNEDLFVFQKFMRLAIGTNNVESGARYGQVNAAHALRRVQGTVRWTVTFEDIVRAEALLLVGTNITEANPITGLKVKEAVKTRGATLATIESLQPGTGTISNITNLAAHHIPAHPDRIGDAVLGLIKAVVEQGLVDPSLAARGAGFVKAIGERARSLGWAELEAATGAGQAVYQAAARTFARASRAVVVVGQGALRQAGGSAVATTLLDLLLLTGQHGRPGCGLAPLAEENNDQGAVELGALAEYLPGPVDAHNETERHRLAGLWKEDLPQRPGATLTEMIEQARTGHIKAMFVVGENPAGTLPTTARVLEALQQLELLVCHELFLTDTAALAHVVLPACSYAEKAGTFTNTEGHVQRIRQALDPVGDSRPDWEILSAVSVLLGYPLEYGDAHEILKEIGSVIPAYSVLGPAPTPPRPDDRVVARYLQEGYAVDLHQRYALAGTRQGAQSAPPEGTLRLLPAQSLFHSGKLSTRAKGLLLAQPEGMLLMNAHDADRRHLADGDRVRVANTLGEMTTRLKVQERIPAGLAVYPEHFDQELRRLASVSVDPVTKVPYFKLTRVTIERL